LLPVQHTNVPFLGQKPEKKTSSCPNPTWLQVQIHAVGPRRKNEFANDTEGGAMENEPQKNVLMKRYELTIEGKTALLEYVEQGGNVLAFTHTFVPPELRGRNVAAILTKFALDDARSQGKKVVPQCSYAATYMERNKEYADLRAGF
jgi:uncharacterized protein